MGRRHQPEEVIGKLREAEILLSQGGSVADASRRIGVTQQTYYRWRKEFGGLKMDQARRMKELERENARLRQAVSELAIDKQILREAARGHFYAPLGAARTSSLRSRRATGSATHSRLASSMTDRMRNLRPSWVRPSTKS